MVNDVCKSKFSLNICFTGLIKLSKNLNDIRELIERILDEQIEYILVKS